MHEFLGLMNDSSISDTNIEQTSTGTNTTTNSNNDKMVNTMIQLGHKFQSAVSSNNNVNMTQQRPQASQIAQIAQTTNSQNTIVEVGRVGKSGNGDNKFKKQEIRVRAYVYQQLKLVRIQDSYTFSRTLY